MAFAWKDGEYGVSWADDEEGDASLLEDHDAHAWLAGLLPGEEVSEGGSWDIDTTALLSIFAPCGDLHLEVEMDGDAGMSMGPDAELFTNLRQLMDGALEGSSPASSLATVRSTTSAWPSSSSTSRSTPWRTSRT